jgi:hypothetical protein
MTDFVALCKAGLPSVPASSYFACFKELDLDGDQQIVLHEWLKVCGGKLEARQMEGQGKGEGRRSSDFTEALASLLGWAPGELKDRLKRGRRVGAPAPDSSAPDDRRGTLADTIWLACERGSLAAVRRMVETVPVGEGAMLLNAPHPNTGKHSLL